MSYDLHPVVHDAIGIKIIDDKGVVHDWEEVGLLTPDKVVKPKETQKIVFSYNKDDRFLLVLAADKLGVGVSLLISSISQMVHLSNDLEKTIKKGKIPKAELMEIKFLPNSENNPLRKLCDILRVGKFDLPETVGTLVKSYNDLVLEAQKRAGLPPKPAIEMPPYAENPFLKSKSKLNLASDITPLSLSELKREWYSGNFEGFLKHFLMNLLLPKLTKITNDIKMGTVFVILQDMVNVLFGWNTEEMDNYTVNDSLEELNYLGAVDKNLPPPYLTSLGMVFREAIIRSNPGHLCIVRRLKVSHPLQLGRKSSPFGDIFPFR